MKLRFLTAEFVFYVCEANAYTYNIYKEITMKFKKKY